MYMITRLMLSIAVMVTIGGSALVGAAAGGTPGGLLGAAAALLLIGTVVAALCFVHIANGRRERSATMRLEGSTVLADWQQILWGREERQFDLDTVTTIDSYRWADRRHTVAIGFSKPSRFGPSHPQQIACVPRERLEANPHVMRAITDRIRSGTINTTLHPSTLQPQGEGR